MKMLLNLDAARHDYAVTPAKGLSYSTLKGWAIVFFDPAGAYYAPAELFTTQADADAYIGQALADGVHIA